MRIALGIEYHGTRFHGWQAQLGGEITVQGELERALSKIADSPITTIAAGRTDAGVHALSQVVHFDCERQRDTEAWVRGTNSELPPEIRVKWAQVVDDSFHARFSAVARTYHYLIYNNPVCSAVMSTTTTHHYRALNYEIMAQAAKDLVGKHDFSAFRASECQAKSPVREVEYLHIRQKGDLIVIDIKANAFLHHMVRNIAGVLMAIGDGNQPVTWAKKVLEARQRCLGGVTAKPNGLFLVDIDYPPEYDFPKIDTQTTLW